jgi:putative signal transducing protein
LLETNSLSWAHTVKIALEAEGLHAVVLDEHAHGIHAFNIRFRVAVADGELTKAQSIVARIAPRWTGAPPSWRIQKRGLLLGGCGIVLGSYGIARFDDPGPGPVTYAIAGLAVLLVVMGFLLVALGPRADLSSGSNRKGGAA